MDWNNPRILDQMCYDLVLADYKRGLNRQAIDDQANGVQPYTKQEEDDNGIQVNVNHLELTRILHDARAQFKQGIVNPARYFTATVDCEVPLHLRADVSAMVTDRLNKILKGSLSYFERLNAEVGMLVEHGIAPAQWEDEYRWAPRPTAIGDMLIPAETLLGFENLPYYVSRRSFTARELWKLTKSAKPDPGWNQPLVDSCLEWIDHQMETGHYQRWPDIWRPEEASARLKSEGGYYVADSVPTIDTYIIHGWVDGKEPGFVRRIIVDNWSEVKKSGDTLDRTERDYGDKSDEMKQKFLYSSGTRIVGSDLSRLACWSFADLSAVFPLRYNHVRSLGFLMYSICKIQDRLRCRFDEALFESMMMYFRTASDDDVQRALKINLANRGFIPQGVDFVKQEERFQIRADLVQLGLAENQRIINANAGSMTATPDFARDRTEKTKFQVMAELDLMTSMINSALEQAFRYKTIEYREIFRRFCIEDSKDPDVIEFRKRMQKDGLNMEWLKPEYWVIEAERVVGGGNRTKQMLAAQTLMEYRPLYDPPSQRVILRMATGIIGGDHSLANQLVPQEQSIGDSAYIAQLSMGALFQGLPVNPQKDGINQVDYIVAALASMAAKINEIEQSGGMAAAHEIAGLGAMAQNIQAHIQILAGDKAAGPLASQYSQQLSNMENSIRAYTQRLQQQMKAKQQQNGGMTPESMAKIQSATIEAQGKDRLRAESHAQRTAQRNISFQQDELRKDQANQADIRRKNALAASQAETESMIAANRQMNEPPENGNKS